MPRIDLFRDGFTYVESEGCWVLAWDALTPAEQAEETARAWDKWAAASCEERNGGHSWWLEWDEEDGLHLHCRHCPAGDDELHTDGGDLICGELPVPGYAPLLIESGQVTADPALVGPLPGEEDVDAVRICWSGPVRARVEEKCYPGGYLDPPEWRAWVVVEAVA